MSDGDRAARYRLDALGVPATLAAYETALTGLNGPLAGLPSAPGRALAGRAGRILLVGMGSSRFAALSAASFLRGRGLTVDVELASTSRPTPPAPGLTVVAISSSGTTPEVLAAVERHTGRSALTVAVTNRTDSPLAAAAEAVVPLLAAAETGGVACRTYVASVASLLLLADRSTTATPGTGLVPPAVRLAVSAADDLVSRLPLWQVQAADLLDRAEQLHVLGDAARFGSAEQAALVLREGPRLAAVAFDAGDWLHVGLYTAVPGFRAILFSGTEYDAEVARIVAERGGELVAIGRPVDGAALGIGHGAADRLPASALVETLVTDLIAAELWRRADATEHP
jgi:glucosamine--fructose-6-phosphate aminotransferase (isomerizing)